MEIKFSTQDTIKYCNKKMSGYKFFGQSKRKMSKIKQKQKQLVDEKFFTSVCIVSETTRQLLYKWPKLICYSNKKAKTISRYYDNYYTSFCEKAYELSIYVKECDDE